MIIAARQSMMTGKKGPVEVGWIATDGNVVVPVDWAFTSDMLTAKHTLIGSVSGVNSDYTSATRGYLVSNACLLGTDGIGFFMESRGGGMLAMLTTMLTTHSTHLSFSTLQPTESSWVHTKGTILLLAYILVMLAACLLSHISTLHFKAGHV